MKIIIASTIVPFVNGGARFFVDWLEEKLNEYGHQAEPLLIPYSMNYKEVMEQMLALRLYHLEEYCDRLIAVRTPAYLLKHPEKYLWFIHHHREMYDLWDTEYNGLQKTAEVLAVREYIKRSDDLAFSESKKIYTNSQEVSDRLMEYNKIVAPPVYPPLLHPEQFYCESYGDYVYYSSRVNGHKRQLLAVQAMKYVKSDVKLLITGKCDDLNAQEAMATEIRTNNLQKKVTIINDWISEEEKAKHMANCLAAIYIPYAEDSYGYPSLEAHHSHKAVISCTDSGGTRELIQDGYNGYMVDPSPQMLAEKFDLLYENKKLAEEMGNHGIERMDALNINWDYVVGRFTQ